jgi:Protein of unknown function (DUF4244)
MRNHSTVERDGGVSPGGGNGEGRGAGRGPCGARGISPAEVAGRRVHRAREYLLLNGIRWAGAVMATGGRRVRSDRGTTTAEYAIVTMAAVAFAGTLVAILRSGAVRGLLLSLVQRALDVA